MGTLTDGQGTPWGPMQSGRPTSPTLVSDPSQVTGFNDSPLRAAYMQGAQQRQGLAQQQLGGMLDRVGMRGPNQQSADGNFQGQAAMSNNLLNQELGADDWETRQRLMEEQNQGALQNYGINAGNYNAEQGARGQFYGGLANAGLGAYMINRMRQNPYSTPSQPAAAQTPKSLAGAYGPAFNFGQ